MPAIDLSTVDLRTIKPSDLDWRKFTLDAGHPMRRVFIWSVAVNMGIGQSGERLEKAAKVMAELTGRTPSYRLAHKSIKDFGIRRGEPIGLLVTLRKNEAVWFLLRALAAVDFTLKEESFNAGNVSFGIREHILVPGSRYEPALGIFGFDVAVTLARPGYRVQYRRRARADVGKAHRVTREETIRFFQDVIGVRILKR
nr:50S ribosomal protein L5 [Caldivirga sp. UBA161]